MSLLLHPLSFSASLTLLSNGETRNIEVRLRNKSEGKIVAMR